MNKLAPFPENATIRDKYAPAMEITDPADAALYFERLVEHSLRFFKSRAEAESVERQNLGYYAGYYDQDTRHRVERLFNCAHPIFGSIAKVGAPDADEALQVGKEVAVHSRKQEGGEHG